MMGRRCSRAGFTLAEVLVATMLLTIVMTAVYTLFFTVISTWRSGERDGGFHREARSVLATMRHEYNNVHPSGSYYFEGGDDWFTLYTLVRPMDVASGEGRQLMRVRYRFDAARRSLVREEAVLEGALPAAVRNVETFDRGRIEVGRETAFVVATNLSHFAVRYLWVPRPTADYRAGQPPAPATPVTVPHHRIRWGMPQAIEIDFTFTADDADRAPLSLTARIPTRTFTRQRDSRELSRMLEEAP